MKCIKRSYHALCVFAVFSYCYIYYLLYHDGGVLKKNNYALFLLDQPFVIDQEFDDEKLRDPSGNEARLNSALLEASKKRYTIVIWEAPFGRKKDRSVEKAECGYCDVTYDKSKVNDITTKAVVFHFRELYFDQMPKRRRGEQLYVWWNVESSLNLSEEKKLKLTEYENVFNLTMTYRRDSDIYSPYSTFAKVLNSIRNSPTTNNEIFSRKTKLAIWIVSNCVSTRGALSRYIFASKLVQAGLNLDRKGKCFSENGIVELNDIRKYKFYMAFENAIHCKDYITEKLFRNSFLMGSVPVVLGAPKSDYDAILPHQSFIHVEDFKTPKELVDYLNYLDKNDTAYLQYFKWRTMKVEDAKDYQRTVGFCQLCRVLHGINVDNIYNERSEELGSYIPLFGYPNRSRVVPSLRNWFYRTENRDCLPSY